MCVRASYQPPFCPQVPSRDTMSSAIKRALLPANLDEEPSPKASPSFKQPVEMVANLLHLALSSQNWNDSPSPPQQRNSIPPNDNLQRLCWLPTRSSSS